MARTGYTLPVFAVAAAKAALLRLQSIESVPQVTLDLLPDSAEIPIQQLTLLDAQSAVAITISDPGDNLDLTRDTPIWAWVRLEPRQDQPLILEAGEGLGRTAAGDPAIYSYARQLFDANLLPLIAANQTLRVTIILPAGRQLAQRTSNAAFGVLEGLSLLGTSGISQPLSAAEHLKELRLALQAKVIDQHHLTFCLGSNGMQVAERLGIPAAAVVQTGNWIGAMLVEASLRGAESVLLLGYQGKLIKLAGGIFNTSSHLADAKLEILSAAVIRTGGDLETAQSVLAAPTADAAYKILLERHQAAAAFGWLAQQISERAGQYVQKYADQALQIGTVLFDRQGQIICRDAVASELIAAFEAGATAAERQP
ncbi:MAG: cobalt-precorrin-5B (C(1))-methyltransferase CbiD [Pegethrix bostrychoides GSE-TBD4-15B]|jgi:cobalt-precorrin-5B (C1)-methyltransferase|uniref:Cobalt-precorrin-5B C(1)-methyltransferase n=1 Tax=Pegethrix bostrychoides GSE-TBD4-15B TaxID=2839662 RepID=A0A951P983_9CYAN|nr:cobalt-precorrin-5B (C(1))-methyltransferase CbiD [Pegethrix bostrychoides GSE-TBD4-15B]